MISPALKRLIGKYPREIIPDHEIKNFIDQQTTKAKLDPVILAKGGTITKPPRRQR